MVLWILLFCFSNYFSAHAGQIKVNMNMNIKQTAKYYINMLNYDQYNQTIPPSISGGVGQPVTKRVYEVVINGHLENRTFYVVNTYNPLNSMGFCNQDKDCPNLPKTLCFGGECLEMWCRFGNDCPPESGCVNSRCRWAENQINCPCTGECDCPTSEENVTKRVYQIVVNGRIEVLTYLVVRTYRPLNALRQCALDTDCPDLSEVFCFFGECMEMLCSSGSQCPSGHMCVDSRCRRAAWVDKNNTTSVNITARPFEILINGTYQIVTFYIVKTYPSINYPGECTMDTQCPNQPEVFCFGGECLEMQCKDDKQCPPGRPCINSRCRRAQPQIGRLCSSDADCPSPVYSTCVANTCKALNQSCSAHTDCPKYPDVYCVSGYCVKLGQECEPLKPCPFMGYTICAGSKCYPYNLPCKVDSDCPSTSLKCSNSFCASASNTAPIRPPGGEDVTPGTTTLHPPNIGTGAPATTTAASSTQTPADVKEQILHWQNWYRSQLARGRLQNAASGTMPPAADMNILEWDTELESGAYEFAKGCSMKPSNLSTRPDDGESIWTNKNPNVSPLNAALSAIGHWWTAPRLNGVFERVFTKAYQESEQLYAGWSQSAWSRTTKIGCYAQRCTTGMFVVCRYHERGNIIGSPFYVVGNACTACKSGTRCLTGEYRGLCSPSP